MTAAEFRRTALSFAGATEGTHMGHPDSRVAVKFQIVLSVIVSLLAFGAGAQSAPQQPAAISPVGVWRGTSVCLVRPSACKDEVIVFRIAQAKSADSVMLDGRKVVGGVEDEMGVLACTFTAQNGQLTCALPQGIWQFRVRHDSLVGALRLTDGTKVRDVRTIRSR